MKEEKLGNLCTITSSKRIFANQYVNEGVPFYRSKEIIEKNDFKQPTEPLYIAENLYEQIEAKYGVPKEGDMLLTSVGTLGIPYIVKNERFYFKDGNLTWFKDFKDSLSSKYLYYCLTSTFGRQSLLNIAIGSSQPALTIEILKRYKINVPKRVVQDKIVEILSAYDELIMNNKQQIKILEQMAENLYKEWFVRFRFPGYEMTEFVDGVPKGWKYRKLKSLLEIFYGKDHKKIADGDIPIFGSGGIMRYGNKLLYDGEVVLIPRKGTLNNIMYYSGKVWTVDTMFYAVPKISNTAKYIYYTLNKFDMESYNSGAALPSMTTAILYNLKMILPDENILEKYDALVGKLFEEKKCLEKQNQNLMKQRDLLLPRLMSGKLQLK